MEPDKVKMLIASTPESSGYKIDDNEFVLFDHSGIIREYKTRLVNNHARYNALKQDFDELEDKYNSLLIGASSSIINKNNGIMEQEIMSTPQMQTPTEQESFHQISEERNALQARLDQLNHSFQNLEKENQGLQARLELMPGNEDGKFEQIERWREENQALKNKLAEQEYIKDVLEEKKSQIEFLQQQLEQRIRNYHQSEQALKETRDQLQRLRLNTEDAQSAIQAAKQALSIQQEETEQLKSQLTHNEAALEESQHQLASRQDHIIYLENLIKETREQNEMLNAAVGDNQEKVDNLRQLLEDEQSRVFQAEQRLQSNKLLLQRLYKEFSACIKEEEMGGSPVVNLRPAYVNNEEWDETAAQ